MNKEVFLRGSSLISSLGENKRQSASKMLELNNSNYQDYLDSIFEDRFFYKFKSNYTSHHDKFFTVLKNIIKDSIKDANLSEEEAKDMHIFIGSTSMSIALLEEHYAKSNHEMLYIEYSSIGEYIENLIQSKHQATIIQSACTSSANALILAAQQIKNGQIKRALIIGFEIFNNVTYKGFESLMLLSKSGVYKPFDKTSDGLVLGEACSAVILDSIPNNQKSIRYISSNSSFDGYSDTGANPDGIVTYECMKNAIISGNLTLQDITCIKAHATGTETSNSSEAKAVQLLFDFFQSQTDVISLKPYIGHTLGACGTNEIVLFCEAISQNFVPQTLGFEEHYENVDFDPLTTRKCLDNGIFLLNFIGFGGTNTSIVLSVDK
jgi:3-oxoacyl-[acyl-carrier-protein] synthase II